MNYQHEIPPPSNDNVQGIRNDDPNQQGRYTARKFQQASDCSLCSKNFHAFRRKHRCKSCGLAVCSNCAKTHKVLQRSDLVTSNDPVRVCDRCVKMQQEAYKQKKQAAEIERSRARQQAQLEVDRRSEELRRERAEKERAEEEARNNKEYDNTLAQEQYSSTKFQNEEKNTIRNTHEGQRNLETQAEEKILPNFEQSSSLVESSASMQVPNIMPSTFPASEKAQIAVASAPDFAPERKASIVEMVAENDECAICLDPMEPGAALLTTACGHSFHWSCLKAIQKSDVSNYDKCPSCRETMDELKIEKKCDHPRVRSGHKFCRDCGAAVSSTDIKPSPLSPQTSSSRQRSHSSQGNPFATNNRTNPESFRAGSQGAIVRCPQCHMQMRVLPHMYNMRVACPAGHQFQVAISNSSSVYPGSAYRGNPNYR